MKRTLFAAIAVVSIAVVAGIDAAEVVRKGFTAVRAQPIATSTFNINLPRHSERVLSLRGRSYGIWAIKTDH